MFYLLDDPMFPCRWMDDEPYLEGISFWRGSLIANPIHEPLEYLLKRHIIGADGHGPDLPPYFLSRLPLFRDDFIDALHVGGVDNLQLFRAVIHDPDNGKDYLNYKAVNLIGLIRAADMNKSEATVHPGGPPLLDVDFDSLVIDESTTYNLKIFRLAESSSAILLHDSLVDHLLKSGFELYTDKELIANKKPNASKNLTLLDPKNCAI